MCGRYVTPSESEIERFWHLGRHNTTNPLERRFNVSPTAHVPMLLLAEDAGLLLTRARWRLIPAWWKNDKPPRSTFNARSEEAAGKPMWRQPVARARCLVPALGWYEWKSVERTDPRTGEVKTVKQPYFIRRDDGEPFAFAGLMARHAPADGETEWTCAILTRDAEGPAKDIHERMPVVLAREAEAAWLDPGLDKGADALTLARRHSVTRLGHHAVSLRVNNARSEGPELIEPLKSAA